MNTRKRIRKLHTQHSLQWSLKIGHHLRTINQQKAIQLANVNPTTFHRWISGKLIAPVIKLDKIKHHALALPKRKHRKIVRLKLTTAFDEETLRAKFLWRHMIFDQLGMRAKRRFCEKLRRSTLH